MSKNEKSRRFLLVGNGPYYNRGCEAIVRGTVRVLRAEFGDDVQAVNLSHGRSAAILEQARDEVDKGIRHVPLAYGRWSWPWFRRQAKRILDKNAELRFCSMEPYVRGAYAALKLGGDIYSLDYGLPEHVIDLDRWVQQRDVPIVLWGASVGPFDNHPEFAERMLAHLRSLDAIFVRESVTMDYLEAHGIRSNVHRVCDPAFVMEPVEPSEGKMGFSVPEGAIGFNFSPILAKRVGGGDLAKGTQLCTEVVVRLANEIGRDIMLITHVTGDQDENDHSVLASVAEASKDRVGVRILCAPDNLSAAETKWLISQCSVFAGARTHSTIAAWSSCVPTLSFAYSVKARGLNEDIYGSREYCLDPEDVSPETTCERIGVLVSEESGIRSQLRERMEWVFEMAYKAGSILRDVAERRACPGQ